MDNQEYNRTTGSELILQNISEKKIRDVFLQSSQDVDEAEIIYPSKMNSKVQFHPALQGRYRDIADSNIKTLENLDTSKIPKNPFIVANTEEVGLQHLNKDCIIPVFSKDNERTISHQEFIETALTAARSYFTSSIISPPEIRVSHQIKGRIPEAIHKPAKELDNTSKKLDHCLS